MSSAEQQAILTRILKSQDGFTRRIEWDSGGNPLYIGDADPGTGITETGWRIKKITWNSSGNPTEIKWASGSREFKFIWNDRTSYIYS